MLGKLELSGNISLSTNHCADKAKLNPQFFCPSKPLFSILHLNIPPLALYSLLYG